MRLDSYVEYCSILTCIYNDKGQCKRYFIKINDEMQCDSFVPVE
jgi:hypothetical protein